MVDRIGVSAREFLTLPETNLPTELIEGEIVVSPAPNIGHQRIVGRLYLLLSQRLTGGELLFAPLDVHFDDSNVVQPDLLWVSGPESQCQPVGNRHWHGAPDLVIEITSPGTARRDRGSKFQLYERYGVREYWMVDIDAEYVEVHQHGDGRFGRVGIFGPGQAFESPLLAQAFDVSDLLGLPKAEPKPPQEEK